MRCAIFIFLVILLFLGWTQKSQRGALSKIPMPLLKVTIILLCIIFIVLLVTMD
jgi:hypothetical protein